MWQLGPCWPIERAESTGLAVGHRPKKGRIWVSVTAYMVERECRSEFRRTVLNYRWRKGEPPNEVLPKTRNNSTTHTARRALRGPSSDWP